VVQPGGGNAGDVWGEVTGVVAEVKSGEHEIGRGRGFTPPKQQISSAWPRYRLATRNAWRGV
jgi:hypothetical protein